MLTFKRTLAIVAAVLLAAAAASADPFDMSSTDVVVPGAGRGAGAFGSFWVTDMWLRCDAGSSVTLEFHGMDSPSAAPTASATLTMSAPVMYLPDVLGTTLQVEGGVGNLRVLSSSPVAATIRLYDRGASGGSYGYSFMGMPSSMGMGAWMGGMMGSDSEEMHRFYILGLLPEPEARVNVMVTNSSDSAVTGTVQVLDADGNDPASGAKSFRFSLQPYSCHQFLDVLSGVASRYSGGAGMQIRVELDEGSAGAMMALATVVDNATNDGYVVMGSMMGNLAAMGGGMGPH